MRIKLAILEADQSYLNRIVSVFNTKYSDKFEVYSFTDINVAMSTLDSARIDVLIASDLFEIEFEKLPARCGFAYLTETVGIEEMNEQRAICKFQKADLIYKQILSVYSENMTSVTSIKLGDGATQILTFCSPSGGVGTSSFAAATAINFASKNKKVLYLNLEKYGSSDMFFKGEGQFDMSDIIFALKSKKNNLLLKLESSVKQDESGVYFYSQSKIALDMQEITVDDVARLISEVKIMGTYDYVIIDMDFAYDAFAMEIYNNTQSIIWVGDGSEISNNKLYRAYNAGMILEQEYDNSMMKKTSIVYNKFSSKTGKIIEELDIKNLGGAPVYMHADTFQVVKQLSVMELFDKMI